jgi:hypothetical protein
MHATRMLSYSAKPAEFSQAGALSLLCNPQRSISYLVTVLDRDHLATTKCYRAPFLPRLSAYQPFNPSEVSRKSATIFGQGTIPEPSTPHIGREVALVARTAAFVYIYARIPQIAEIHTSFYATRGDLSPRNSFL